MNSSTKPSTTPSNTKDQKPATDGAQSADKSGSNAKPSSSRSAQQGEKKTTPH